MRNILLVICLALALSSCAATNDFKSSDLEGLDKTEANVTAAKGNTAGDWAATLNLTNATQDEAIALNALKVTDTTHHEMTESEATTGTGTTMSLTTPSIMKACVLQFAGGGSMVYPGAGIAYTSDGLTWDTSYTVTTLKDAMQAEDWVFAGSVDVSTTTSYTQGFWSLKNGIYAITPSVDTLLANWGVLFGNYEMRIPKSGTVNSDGTITDALEFVFDGGGSAIAASELGRLVIPWAAEIQTVEAYCSPSGSITFGITKATDAAFPTMTSIVASEPPVVTSSQKITANALTGWTTTLAAGDIMEVTTAATPATVENCTLYLEVKR